MANQSKHVDQALDLKVPAGQLNLSEKCRRARALLGDKEFHEDMVRMADKLYKVQQVTFSKAMLKFHENKSDLYLICMQIVDSRIRERVAEYFSQRKKLIGLSILAKAAKFDDLTINYEPPDEALEQIALSYFISDIAGMKIDEVPMVGVLNSYLSVYRDHLVNRLLMQFLRGDFRA